MPKDRSRVIKKYQDRVASSGPEYANGVQNPKADWLASYTAAQPRMAAGLQAALAAGTPVKQAQAKGGTANWQSKAADKGARNYAAAAPDAAKGYEQTVDKVLAAGDAARSAAAKMPNTTYEQRKARAAAAMDAIHNHWKK